MKVRFEAINFGLFKPKEGEINKYRSAITFIPLLEMIDAYNDKVDPKTGEPKVYTNEEMTILGKLINDHLTLIPIKEEFANDPANDAYVKHENEGGGDNSDAQGKSKSAKSAKSFAMPQMMSMQAPQVTSAEEVKETEVEVTDKTEVNEELPSVDAGEPEEK